MKKTIQQFNNSTIQQIDYFKFSWIWLCLIMLPINILAQEAQSFYVVEKQNETVNLNNYAPGYYIVTLVCDGQIINSKHLIKN
ncbi:hypothetical protein SAMN05444278_10221 [Psychroflexus salarius]|uniref:Uncharacterized protein n=1 Tax=Psychroflexus salarius TaxID=1155689 RepID=A0A1M4TU85_9FLAO|nr:hypothetical protein [Psychroflexus salarius]SHE47954.1 hypothetical protein SAMN05444278_10221 [Psychroflexus salarius]